MKKGLTELVFILDRSGSMAGLEQDTIGGYNALLEQQKEEPGKAIITTVLFDDRYELLHDRMDLDDAVPITNKEYFVRGTTALLDAIGHTVHKINKAHKNTPKEDRAERVLFIITTDGMENASKKYHYNKVKDVIERQKEKRGWEFLFIGANMDAVKTAGRFGISANCAANYHADGLGTAVMYEAISKTVCCIRANQAVPVYWKVQIEEDFVNRK